MNNHHLPNVSAPAAGGNTLGPRVPIGSIWQVSNRNEVYFAEVLAYQGDRAVIRRVCPKNIIATPTLARFSDFAFFRRSEEGFAS